MHTVADLVHTVTCVITGEKPKIRGDHCAHVIEIIEKAYESAKTGRAVELTTTFERF
jgi:predicted dehydrogenase